MRTGAGPAVLARGRVRDRRSGDARRGRGERARCDAPRGLCGMLGGEPDRRRAGRVIGRRPVPGGDAEHPHAEHAEHHDHRGQAGGHGRRGSQLHVGVARHLADDPSGVHIAHVGS
jgi:hypothetical protein